MLIYDELRSEIALGKTELSSNDFITEFGRRAFEVICSLEIDEYGFSKAMLGQHFTPDEIGKLEQIEQNRRKYTINDRAVMLEYIKNLKEERAMAENKDDINYILNSKRNRIREAKNKTDV